MRVQEEMSASRSTSKVCAGISPHGKSLHVLDEIAAGEVIIGLDGHVVATPDKYTVQIDEGRHLAPNGSIWAFANHSCLPNARIDFAQFALVALTAIRPGEDVTFNYLTTEMDMAAAFKCGCGAPGCAGMIAGFRHLSRSQKAALRPWLSDSLARAFELSVANEEDEAMADQERAAPRRDGGQARG